MHSPTDRLRQISQDPGTAGCIRALIDWALSQPPISVAEDVHQVAALLELRADWVRRQIHYERPSAENSHHFVDAMMIATNPEGTGGVAVWQGRAGNGAPDTDLRGEPIVEGAWYVLAEKDGAWSVVSGPRYPLGDAAEEAARFLRRRRDGFVDDHVLDDVAGRRIS